jgi:hypothetical protein
MSNKVANAGPAAASRLLTRLHLPHYLIARRDADPKHDPLRRHSEAGNLKNRYLRERHTISLALTFTGSQSYAKVKMKLCGCAMLLTLAKTHLKETGTRAIL